VSRSNQIGRFFRKLKHFRGVATRSDKTDGTFLASVQPATTRIWLQAYEAVI